MLNQRKTLVTLSGYILLFILLASFNSSSKPILVLIGNILLAISLLAIFFLFIVRLSKNSNIKKDIIYTSLPLLTLSIIYFFNSILFVNIGASLTRGFLILVNCITIYFFIYVGKLDNGNTFKSTLLLLLSSYTLIVLILFIQNPSFNDFSLYFANPNAFGLAISLVYIIILSFIDRKFNFLLFFIAGLFFVFISSSRTSLLAFIISSAYLITGNKIIRFKRLYMSVIYLIILISILIIYFMSYFDLSIYNDTAKAYTHKNLLSGRSDIWVYMLELINQKPLLGWGGGINLADLSYFTYSSHNLYLQTAIQVGYIGVLLIYIFYISLWHLIRKYALLHYNYKHGIRANALLIWLILIQNFEITFLQNNIALSLPIICVIGYNIGKTMNAKSDFN